ncbi:MAG TPA: alpha/beta fold hydrolase [Casimicrobiaceae bacterium]|nr:alpha/beta fold hydrolase [Casimicrobiaceae bacterium]
MRGPDAVKSAGPYRAPPWLRGGHAQTIYPSYLKRERAPLRRERVFTADGDFWDFDWLDTPATPDAPLVVLFHGLEGGSGSHYARALMHLLAQRGWRGVIPHFRGCSGEPNRLARAYHSGDHEDVGAMLQAIHERRGNAAALFAVGVSLGGSALLNWLGRHGEAATRIVQAAAAISTPIDLTAAGIAIGQGLNRIYTVHFLTTLKPKSLAMAKRFPGVLSETAIRAARTMWEFDEVVTAPLHGFTGADDYWRRASCKPWLTQVRVPTLVLNALNDPFIPAASLPSREETSNAITLERPEHGGHAGFASGPFPGHVRWLPLRLVEFFEYGR